MKNSEFDESATATSLLCTFECCQNYAFFFYDIFTFTTKKRAVCVSFPGYSNEEFWLPVISEDKWHGYQLSKVILDEKYSECVNAQNIAATKSVIESSKEYLDSFSDSADDDYSPKENSTAVNRRKLKRKRARKRKEKNKNRKALKQPKTKRTRQTKGVSFTLQSLLSKHPSNTHTHSKQSKHKAKPVAGIIDNWGDWTMGEEKSTVPKESLFNGRDPSK